MGNAVSLNPDTFVEGGGLIDDVDVTFKECDFVIFDYNGKVNPGVPSLHLTMALDEGDDVEQYYSVGSVKDWMPSDDGKQLVAVGSASGLRMSSNGGILLKSLIDAGFPADDLGDDISVLTGLQAHMIRVPAPVRNIKNKPEKKFEDTILIVSEIISLPGEKKKPAGAPKSSAKTAAKPKGKAAATKAAPAKEEAGDVAEKAVEAVMGILAENGSTTKKELPGKIFSTMKDDPDRNAIVKMVFDDEFLGDGPWVYDPSDGSIVMG